MSFDNMTETAVDLQKMGQMHRTRLSIMKRCSSCLWLSCARYTRSFCEFIVKINNASSVKQEQNVVITYQPQHHTLHFQIYRVLKSAGSKEILSTSLEQHADGCI